MRDDRWKTLLLAVGVAAALGAAAAPAQERPPDPGAQAAPSDDGQTQWARPETASSLPAGEVKARPVEPPAPPRASAYAGLRALSLAEGEALLQLGDGEQRRLRPGDPWGTDRVEVVDEGLIVLTRPEQPGRPGGQATVVIRFDEQGHPSVRIYHAEDPAPAATPGAH